MGEPTLAFDGPVAVLTFERPGKRNALDLATWRAIPRLIGEAVSRRETRVIVVRGAGGDFAAGADIAEFDNVFANRETTLAYLTEMSAATAAIEAAPVPVLARLEGLCIGAGVAVALACDVRVAGADARFAITPAKLGLMYSLADTKRVVDAVGPSAARDLLFTARMIDAATALAMRLVDEVRPGEELDQAIAGKARQIAETSAWTHARTKKVIRQILDGQAADDDETLGSFADAVEGHDYREGLAAFCNRRPARFAPR